MRRRHHDFELRQLAISHVDAAICLDVRFDAFEHPEPPLVAGIQVVDFLVLSGQVRHRHAVRDRQPVGVVGDRAVAVAARETALDDFFEVLVPSLHTARRSASHGRDSPKSALRHSNRTRHPRWVQTARTCCHGRPFGEHATRFPPIDRIFPSPARHASSRSVPLPQPVFDEVKRKVDVLADVIPHAHRGSCGSGRAGRARILARRLIASGTIMPPACRTSCRCRRIRSATN